MTPLDRLARSLSLSTAFTDPSTLPSSTDTAVAAATTTASALPPNLSASFSAEVPPSANPLLAANLGFTTLDELKDKSPYSLYRLCDELKLELPLDSSSAELAEFIWVVVCERYGVDRSALAASEREVADAMEGMEEDEEGDGDGFDEEVAIQSEGELGAEVEGAMAVDGEENGEEKQTSYIADSSAHALAADAGGDSMPSLSPAPRQVGDPGSNPSLSGSSVLRFGVSLRLTRCYSPTAGPDRLAFAPSPPTPSRLRLRLARPTRLAPRGGDSAARGEAQPVAMPRPRADPGHHLVCRPRQARAARRKPSRRTRRRRSPSSLFFPPPSRRFDLVRAGRRCCTAAGRCRAPDAGSD